MSDRISSVSKSCFLSISDLHRTRKTLDYTTAHTTATSLIHSKLDYCNSLFLSLTPSLNSIVFSSFSALPLEQFLNLPNSVSSLLFSSIFIGSKFNSVSSIKSYLLPTKLFRLDNLLISIAFSKFNITAQLAPLT